MQLFAGSRNAVRFVKWVVSTISACFAMCYRVPLPQTLVCVSLELPACGDLRHARQHTALHACMCLVLTCTPGNMPARGSCWLAQVRLSFDYGEFYIDVLISLDVGQAFAELLDIRSNRHGKLGFELKQRRAAHRSVIRLRFHRFDVDGQLTEHAADPVNNPRMIHARSRQFAGNECCPCWFSRRRCFDGDG